MPAKNSQKQLKKAVNYHCLKEAMPHEGFKRRGSTGPLYGLNKGRDGGNETSAKISFFVALCNAFGSKLFFLRYSNGPG